MRYRHYWKIDPLWSGKLQRLNRTNTGNPTLIRYLFMFLAGVIVTALLSRVGSIDPLGSGAVEVRGNLLDRPDFQTIGCDQSGKAIDRRRDCVCSNMRFIPAVTRGTRAIEFTSTYAGQRESPAVPVAKLTWKYKCPYCRAIAIDDE